MKKNEETNVQEMSHSKAKREARKKEVAKEKRSTVVIRIVGYLVLALMAAGIIFLIANGIHRASLKVSPISDYTETASVFETNGFVKGVTATSYVTPADYSNIQVPYSEIAYTDDQIQADIDSVLNSHKVENDDASLEVKNGDSIKLSYAGTIDGAAFDGGTSESANLTIGSGQFIDNFEEQLIGSHPGDNVIVNVTFPADYSNAALAGKPAQFDCTIQSIMVAPEFTDDFVKENLSDYADSTEGYRTYLRETNEETNLQTWMESYLTENTIANSYPKQFVNFLKKLEKYDAMNSYEYMNAYYSQYMGYTAYNSFEDYVGSTEEAYDLSLEEVAKGRAKDILAYQAILEKEGVSVTPDDYKAYLTETGKGDYDSMVSSFSEGYVMQQYVQVKATEIAIANATIDQNK